MSSRLLATPRLSLRPLTLDDLDAFHALSVQPGVRRFLFDNRTIGRDEAQAMLEACARLFDVRGYGLWAIREAPGEALRGWTGLWIFEKEPELAYALDMGHWGRGLGIEAATAVLAYARDTLRMRRLLASTDLANARSVRLLNRLGFVETGRRPGPTGTLRVFASQLDAEHRASGWAAR